MSVSIVPLCVCVYSTSLCLCASSLPSVCCPSAKETSEVTETTTAALTSLMTDYGVVLRMFTIGSHNGAAVIA